MATDMNDMSPEDIRQKINDTSDYAPVDGLVLRKVSEIEMMNVQWLWHKWFALGKLAVFAGIPGLGKSTIFAMIAAILTRGGIWPDGTIYNDPGNVITLSAEDDAEDTIAPRMAAAGADLEKVHIVDAVRNTTHDGVVQRSFNLAEDIERLEEAADRLGNVRAIMLDPISAYLGGTDSHKNSDMRSLLEPLTKLAERKKIAVLALTHFNKNTSGGPAINKILGSIGMAAHARHVFAVVQEESDDECGGQRLLLPIKNNLGNDKVGYGFTIQECVLENDIVTSKVVFDSSPVAANVEEVLEVASTDDRSALDEAKDFLQSALSDGSMLRNDIKRMADEQGIADKTLQRASRAIKVQKVKEGFGSTSMWRWSLTPEAQKSVREKQAFKDGQDSKDGQGPRSATFEDVRAPNGQKTAEN